MTPPTPAALRSHANTRWRRHALRVALCLLAGFVITIGVAWGLAMWVDLNLPLRTPLRPFTSPANMSTGTRHIETLPDGNYSKTCVTRTVEKGSSRFQFSIRHGNMYVRGDGAFDLPTCSLEELIPFWLQTDISGWPSGGGGPEHDAVTLDCRGWPMLALLSVTQYRYVGGSPEVEGGIAVAADKVLPLRPIWPGLIINTVFYAVIVFICTFNYVALRRTLRRRKGLCERCRYDLRATPRELPCPECGGAR